MSKEIINKIFIVIYFIVSMFTAIAATIMLFAYGSFNILSASILYTMSFVAMVGVWAYMEDDKEEVLK